MAKGCVYIPKTGKDAGKVFGSKDSLAAHMNYTPAMADVMAKYEKTGGAMNLDSVTKWLTDNGYLKAEAKKPTASPKSKQETPQAEMVVQQPQIEKDIFVGSITQTSLGWESATKEQGPGDMRSLGYSARSGVEIAKGEDGKTYAVAFSTRTSDGNPLTDKSGRPGFFSVSVSVPDGATQEQINKAKQKALEQFNLLHPFVKADKNALSNTEVIGKVLSGDIKIKTAPKSPTTEKKPTTKKEFPTAPVTDAVKTALKSVDNTTAAIMNLAKVLPTVYESITKQVKITLGKPVSQQVAEAYHNAVENGVEPELVAAVENAVALQEQMKSKPSMASDIETAETLEVEGVPNGVRVSNKASMAELERRNSGNATKKATIAMARAAAKTLKSVFPMMDIHLHENTADYNNAMSNLNAQRNTAGNFTYSTSSDGTVVGRIDIDLNKAVPRTVVHEVVHAVLLKTFGDSSPAFLEFRKNLEKIVSKSGNARLQAFVDQYKEVADDIGQAEEYLAELGGILSDKEKPLEYGIVRNIAEMINKVVSAITFGRLKVFEDLQNQKDTLEFFNTIAQSIKAGTDISGLTGDNIFVNEKPNAEGEVGVFKLKSKASIAAPKASEDPRPWIKKFVTDVDMMKFDGQPFVTNMYDYTTAGEVTMGEHKIELMGGKSYVPYMMHKNNKKIGDISNLAAFNSKENAEGFVRNAIEGGANLFAPHSGTLSQSWQFQHHTFAELVNLVLDKNILTNEELIGMFNNIIKSAGNKADFKQFREEYFNKSGKKINNFSSFVKNPKEIVELLDIQNNFAPDLRKTLNSTLSANKKFQEEVGIKNKDQFYGLIMDPLNAGVTGGEILGVIDFDPTTFKIVKTTPGATDHHPSFGWALMAKINGIYQPTEFYKSYDVTDTYTKYNKGGVDVSKKSDGFKEFISSNVKSSAGAIPKIAKFNVGDLKSKAQIAINEYEEAPASEKPVLKSKAQVAVFDETGYVSTDFWVENLQGKTKYLDDVVKSILDARNILKKGQVKPEQVVKAYMITLGSMGSGGTYYDNWKEKTGQEVSDIFLEKQKGRDWLRPEGAAAAYLVTDEGKKLIDDMIAGSAKVEQVKKLFDFVGVGRETQKAAYAVKSMENGGIKAMTDTFNENKGKDFAQLYQAAMDNLEGIGEGKTGFFNQYFGVSGRAVIDARELNAWIAGSMKLTPEQVKAKEKAQSSKAIGDMLLNRIEEVGLKLGYSPDMAGYIAHHAIWDGIVGSVTKHAGEYAVVSGKPELKSKAQILGLTGAASLDNAEKILGNLEVAKKMEQELGKQPLTPGKSKADARKIKMATGWERGVDDLWRLEIPDATLKDFKVSDLPKYMASQTRYAKLGDIIDAPELFKAYSVPRGEGKQALKDVVVEFLDTDDFRGAFTEKTQKIQISTNENVNKSPREMLSTMLHEIQHYIQFVEGFETGSTDASMSNIPVVEVQIRRRAKALFNTYNQLVEESKQPGANISSIKEELQVIQSQYSKLKEEIAKPAKELYKRAAGEVEARNVQRRMGLTNEERMGMLLLETEDVYRADQLLLSEAIQTTNLKSKAQMADLKPGEEVGVDGKKIKVYHGADVDFTIEGKQNRIMFTSKDKEYANYYAKQRWGKVFEFDIDESKIAREDYVKEKIKALDLKTQSGDEIEIDDNLHRLIDPRFEDTSISKEGLDKLFSELEKEGYYGVDFMDENQELGGMNEIESIAIFNPKKLLVQPTLKSKAQMVDNNAKQVADLYAQMREGGGWVERQKINAILDQDPKLSYIYNNFKAITQMFEDAELLTKSGNCP